MTFRRFSWIVLGYNLLVILWGAYVRATGSGAGCGSHWPLCTGEVIPRSPAAETIIEFTHRISSGLVLVLAVILVIWAYRLFPKGSPIRKSSTWVFIFTLTEALVGAGLVLFGLTADNDSAARAITIVVHLLNTFLLLGGLSLTSWWATWGEPVHLVWRREGALIAAALVGAALIGASGAITALGDTLFPAGSLAEGLSQDMSPTAHFLTRLRIYHPLIAVAVGGYIIFLVRWINPKIHTVETPKVSKSIIALILIQFVAGATNVVLLAPVWLQMVHLLLADLIWICLIWISGLFFARDLPVDSFLNQPVENGIEKLPT